MLARNKHRPIRICAKSHLESLLHDEHCNKIQHKVLILYHFWNESPSFEADFGHNMAYFVETLQLL